MPLASNDRLVFSTYFSLGSGASEIVKIKMVQCFSLHIREAELMDAVLVYKTCLVLRLTQLARCSRGN